MKLFELFATLGLNSVEFERGLKSAQKSAKDAAKAIALSSEKIISATEISISRVGKAIAATASAYSASAIAIGKRSLDIRSSIEQGIGGAEAIFGDFAWRVKEDAAEAFEKSGLSAEEYYATINKMGALFKGSGFTEMEALEKASNAMQRAADVASVMGIDVDMAMESIAGAAKGNFAMMDNLGVAMNDTTLEAYRLDKGIGKAVSTMTTAEKVGLAMDMFMENTAYAAGNYAKENETAAGSLQTLKAAWSNFLGGVDGVDFTTVSDSAFRYLRVAAKTMGAEGFEPFLQGAQDTVNSAVKILSLEGITGREKYSKRLRLFSGKMKGVAERVKETLPKGIEEAASIATETLSTINVDLPAYLDAGKEIFDSVRSGLKKAAEEFSKTAAIVSPDVISGWFTAKTDFLSIGLDIIGGIATGITEDINKGENSKIAKALSSGISELFEKLPGLIEAGVNLAEGIPNLVATLLDPIGEGLAKVLGVTYEGSAIQKTINEMKDGLVLVNGSIGLIQASWDALTGKGLKSNDNLRIAMNWIIEKFSEIEAAILSAKDAWENFWGTKTADPNATKPEDTGVYADVSNMPMLGDPENIAGPGTFDPAKYQFNFPHASGLPYVPYDNYPARLHRGKMVLTRKDAEDYRAENGGGINTKDLARLLANAVKSSPMNFYMGKKQVAFAISDAVGRRIEKRDHARVSAMGG